MKDEIERGFDPNIIFSRFLATFWQQKSIFLKKNVTYFHPFFCAQKCSFSFILMMASLFNCSFITSIFFLVRKKVRTIILEAVEAVIFSLVEKKIHPYPLEINRLPHISYHFCVS